MKKILVIKDKTEEANKLCEILELSKYKVDSAFNGKEGVYKIRTFNPDLIVCDIMIPEIDGLGVLKILNHSDETKRIPLIFLTAKASADDIRKGMSLGAADYITKPYKSLHVLEAIEQQLQKVEYLQKFAIDSFFKYNLDYNDENLIDDLIGFGENTEISKSSNEKLIISQNVPEGIFYIKNGIIREFVVNNNGKEATLNLLGANKFVGLYESFTCHSYQSNYSCLTDTTLLKFPSLVFHDLILKKPIITKYLIEKSHDLLVEMKNDQLVHYYGSTKEKVVDSLLKVYASINSLEFNIKRSILASIAGIATESYVRSLAELRQEGIVSLKAKKIRIANLQKLKEYFH